MSDFVRQQSVECSFEYSDSWVILSSVEQSIKRKIESIGTPLKDWDIQINYGIKTGFNDAFIINTEKRNEILDNCSSEGERKKTDELIRPILRGRDIKRYGYNWANLWLINTHNGIKEKNIPKIDINEYPTVKKHLDEYWDKLSKRADKGDTPYNLRNCAYMDDFNKPVIAWQRITSKNQFCLTKQGTVILDSMAFLSNLDEKANYLMGILNSSLVYFWIKKNVHEYGDTGFRLSNQYVELIPVPTPISLEIANLVQEEINKHSDELIKIIDRKVYELYGLTEEEINYIEN